jgi:hypothetical protein
MNSISSSWLSQGLIPRAYAFANAAMCSSRTYSRSSSLTLFSPNILLKSRTCQL